MKRNINHCSVVAWRRGKRESINLKDDARIPSFQRK